MDLKLNKSHAKKSNNTMESIENKYVLPEALIF